jgi:hypothetical protein
LATSSPEEETEVLVTDLAWSLHVFFSDRTRSVVIGANPL